MANRLPMVMVATIMMESIRLHWAVIEPKTLTNTTMVAKAAAPFEMTERYAVTLVGAPW